MKIAALAPGAFPPAAFVILSLPMSSLHQSSAERYIHSLSPRLDEQVHFSAPEQVEGANKTAQILRHSHHVWFLVKALWGDQQSMYPGY